VSSRAPSVILDQGIDAHPAVQAWRRLRATRHDPEKVEVWTSRPTSVYRIVFRNGTPAVFAKRCQLKNGAVERLCFESILPRVRVPSPVYYGSLEEADGSCWLFLEDVGRQWFSPHDPEHRVLATRWIGQLHRKTARIQAASALPPAGPQRYLDHLRSARDRIRRNLGNPGLTEADRDVLGSVLTLEDHLESRWDQIERASAAFPTTVVHGDFQAKNVRIRSGDSGPTVCVLDWEMAGWGIPAVDLAWRGIDLSIPAELEAYASEVRMEWPTMDAVAIRRLAVLGVILRRLASMDWETESLHFEDPESLSDPVSSLRSMHVSASRGLAAAEEWLA